MRSTTVLLICVSAMVMSLAVAEVVRREQQRAQFGASCPPICYCLRCQLRRDPPPPPPPPKPIKCHHEVN